MGRLRQALFYVFALLYLVLCPVTIFSALGYVFVPGARQPLVKTGLIYVSSVPSGASIYLGQRRYTRRTPALLEGLRPGAYDVRLSLKGRRPWLEQVPVEPEKATVLGHVLLLPQRLRPTEQSTGAFTDLFPLGASRLLLSAGPRLGDLAVYDARENRGGPLLPFGSPWLDDRLVAAASAGEGTAALLRVAARTGERRLAVDLSDRELRLDDFTSWLPAGTSQVAWDPEEPRWVFALAGGIVQRLDRTSATSPRRIWGRASGMQLTRHALYVVDQDGSVQRFTPDGERVIARLPRLLPAPSSGLLQLAALPDGDLVLVGRRGELCSSRSRGPLIERGVRGMAVLPKSDRVLFWTRERLGMLEPEEPEEDARAVRPLRVQWIFTQGRDLAQGFWVYDGSHVLVRDGSRVLLFALETYGKPQETELLEVKAGSAISYADSSGTLHYLDRDTGRLQALELLPPQEILPLPDWVGERVRRRLEAL